MKNFVISALATVAITASCSTVSNIMQNTFPYSTTFVVTQGSPGGTQLSSVGVGTSINQLTGATANVRDIRASTANVSITAGNQGMGLFKSIQVYLSSGGQEFLVASRDNISDNIGNTLSLDVNSNQILDQVMKSGGTVQQRIVYVLKSSPGSDLTLRSSINFSSVPANAQ